MGSLVCDAVAESLDLLQFLEDGLLSETYLPTCKYLQDGLTAEMKGNFCKHVRPEAKAD